MIYPNDVMNEVLRDEIGCNLFKNYLRTIYCSETLQFWMEIEMFKQVAPPAQNSQGSTGPLVAFSSAPIDQSSSSSNISSTTTTNNNNNNNNNNNTMSSADLSSSPPSPTNNGATTNKKNKSRRNSSDRKYLPQDDLRQKAQAIFDHYLENGSEFELNIDAISREHVRLRLSEEIDANIFDDVQKVVYESLWMDCFPPFTHTAAYHKYKQETGKCHLPEFLRISFKRKSPKNQVNFELKEMR
ncbi:hypothetical protein DFA_06622 [Cavenderia fasciculata]|uniref:RGS domain-containing protein n=1 Tax=Cavenderia fasciculata TaxID=261658 RepID=F4Q1T6_CACFS|nr:uncharacterized protein DFA_06622 [Cavenderia fasciculata]EGG17956.1 hypothetical protein DFA_06622 [Cavenderia fasciculata]|eukprot:XP_004356848.1 hypothetical protein DFA_06622 [Cavenderia fasciculata]